MVDKGKTTKYVVVKLGSSIAITHRGKLDEFRIIQVAKQIRLLKERGFAVVLVISGAVVCGENILRSAESENEIVKQLAASVGQAYIVSQLYKIFTAHDLLLAQILLTKKELEDRNNRERLRNILQMAIETRIVPVLNENDVVELHSFGGNDFLSSNIAKVLRADSLLLLTDVDGVYSGDKQMLQSINASNSDSLVFSADEMRNGRVGGMYSKVEAAKEAANSGIQTTIANGKVKDVLVRLILDQEKFGTKVVAQTR